MVNISPLVKKGALLVYEPNTGIPLNTIAFQYNPEKLATQPAAAERRRTARPHRGAAPQGSGDRDDHLRDRNRCDRPARCAGPTTLQYGIAPQLSTLELLVYPPSSVLIANEVLSLFGTIEILPMSSNLTVLALGPNRVAPVKLNSIEITEEQFDPQLNPIRAKVSLSMRVLNVNDVGFLTPAGAMYMAYQMNKESIAGS